MNIQQNNSATPMNDGYLDRASFLSLMRTGIHCKEYRFTRQIALQWLASFPGDLQASQIYAQALMGESRIGEACKILKGLCQADPENEEAVQLLLFIEQSPISLSTSAIDKQKGAQSSSTDSISTLQNWLTALNGKNWQNMGSPATASKDYPGWGEQIYNIRKNVAANEIGEAEQQILGLLNLETSSPLIALAHLKLMQVNHAAPLAARRSLADYYHRRWPDCLACTIYLASWLIQEGAVERGVALLHQAAARDISGEIADRVLGTGHPYKSLWPDNPAIAMEYSIPASVAAFLGLNRLPEGESAPPDPTLMNDQALIITSQVLEELTSVDPQPSESQKELEWVFSAGVIAAKAINEENGEHAESNLESKTLDEDVLRFSTELDRMAAELNQPPASQYDGRFPVYVIFSVHGNLIELYGEENTARLESEMTALAQAVSTRFSRVGNRRSGQSRWNSIVFLPDNPINVKSLGIEPVKNVDPWSLKLALADLDGALRKKGEMIGAVLIAGGPEIVPFHKLPNPVNDPDEEVDSDNPYTTRDENYFIPEWSIGRLPGGSSKDPALLLGSLQQIRQRYMAEPKSLARPNRWLAWITSWFQPSKKSIRKGFGATAAVWRQASFQVYRPVGDIKSVIVSPPYSVNGSNGNGRSSSGLPFARLGYFNLHGLADAAEWYGQKDPGENGDGPDYPIALRPADIRDLGEKIPLIVFSEACYGAHIRGKSIDQALALQFIKSGAQIVVGSTTMSYGAINTPLIAADLLGYNFWKGLLDGLPAGEALQRAKIQLASEMHQRQGYLDGEDQKTLIAFVLYGDPLTQISSDIYVNKHIRRLTIPTLHIKTVCDRTEEAQQLENMPAEVVAHIKQFVSSYLPGMSDAHVTYAVERTVCQNNGHSCPTGQLKNISQTKSKETDQGISGQRVVVLSKMLEKVTPAGRHVHPQYARLTLDSNGKLTKVVVSR